MVNKNLNDSRIKKNDEFYTIFGDIQKELAHYTEYLKNKVRLLENCFNG